METKPDFLGFLTFGVCIVTMVFILLGACSCARVDNNTKYTLEGDATVHVVVGVDLTACTGLEEPMKSECIDKLIEIAQAVAEAQKAQTTNQGIGGI